MTDQLCNIGNTGAGMVFTGHNFSDALWTQVLGGETTIGAAIVAAKTVLARQNADAGFLHTITLLGDPATKIRLNN